MLRALPLPLALVLALAPACDLLSALSPPPIDGENNGRPVDDDDCDDDEDCRGGEFCDDGECRDIGDEGEGEEGEGEGPPPPPPPECDGAGCPEILSFTSNRSTLTEFDSATLSAVVTDPDGVADVIGGVLLDPGSGDVYGAFSSSSAGAFSVSVSWSLLDPVVPINFNGSAQRTLRARFFDQAGNEVFGDVVVTLACDSAASACDGQCGAERCDGECLTEEQLQSNENCGRCGNACPAGGTCERPPFLEEPTCLCEGGPCTAEGEGEGGEGEGEGGGGIPYSGAREAGVVCGVDGEDVCADACCLDIFTSSTLCAESCQFAGATCDGPEDCGGGEECCFTGLGAGCVSAGSCRADGNREVCVNRNDCAAGELCCTDGAVTAFGGDAGVCAVAEGGACPDLGGGAPPP